MAANAPSGSLVFFARLRLSALRALPQPCCDSRSSAGVLFFLPPYAVDERCSIPGVRTEAYIILRGRAILWPPVPPVHS